jgi:hypothetical protein
MAAMELHPDCVCFFRTLTDCGIPMRSILMLLIGVPLPLVLLVAFCTHHL